MKARRKPRDLESYSPAEEAAQSLESLAAKVRRGGGLVKFSIQLWFWEAPPVARIEEKSSDPTRDLVEALKASLAVSDRSGVAEGLFPPNDDMEREAGIGDDPGHESIADRSERRAARYTREDGEPR